MSKDKDFEKLMAKAGEYEMTAEEREVQRRSFAFGNANIDNPDVTREMIDRAAEKPACRFPLGLSENVRIFCTRPKYHRGEHSPVLTD